MCDVVFANFRETMNLFVVESYFIFGLYVWDSNTREKKKKLFDVLMFPLWGFCSYII